MQLVKKLFYVGEEVPKNQFVANVTGVTDAPSPLSLFTVGLNVTIAHYNGNDYNLWIAQNNSTDENMKMWGKNSHMVVVFGNDLSLFHRCLNLFPGCKVKLFDPTSTLLNLEP